MDIQQFNFQNSATSETDEVLASEQEVFSAAGSSINLFGGGEKPSSSSLTLSTKNDEVLAFSLLKQVARWINKYIKNLNLPYDFKIKFLETSIYNQTDVFNTLLKACQAGVPCKMEIAASLGMSPSDVIGNALIENDILKLRDTLFSQPLLSSSTMSPDKQDGGRPVQDKVDDSGEATREGNANNEN
jgi:O6-methylguanine-DNA--protein-cysteine methyltransferase